MKILKRVLSCLVILLITCGVYSKIASGTVNNWKLYTNSDGVYLHVDTSKAGFKKTPIYFTSLSGESDHKDLTGIESIYYATRKGFSVYVRFRDGRKLSVNTAKNIYKWKLNWIGIDTSTKSIQISKADEWVEKSNMYAFVNHKTSTKGYHVFSSLGGKGHQSYIWHTTGASAICRKKDGFKVQLRMKNVMNQAEKYNWNLNLLKLKKNNKRFVSGSSNKWKVYNNGVGVYIDVDTRKYKFESTPKYFTSLTTNSVNADLTGINSIYNPTKNGFRVYIVRVDGKKFSIKEAKTHKWRLHWMADVPPTEDDEELDE
jgi:hypothetical protein